MAAAPMMLPPYAVVLPLKELLLPPYEVPPLAPPTTRTLLPKGITGGFTPPGAPDPELVLDLSAPPRPTPAPPGWYDIELPGERMLAQAK